MDIDGEALVPHAVSGGYPFGGLSGVHEQQRRVPLFYQLPGPLHDRHYVGITLQTFLQLGVVFGRQRALDPYVEIAVGVVVGYDALPSDAHKKVGHPLYAADGRREADALIFPGL